MNECEAVSENLLGAHMHVRQSEGRRRKICCRKQKQKLKIVLQG